MYICNFGSQGKTRYIDQASLHKYIATITEEHSIQIGLLCYPMTALVVLCYVAVAVVVAVVVVMMIENCACGSF